MVPAPSLQKNLVAVRGFERILRITIQKASKFYCLLYESELD